MFKKVLLPVDLAEMNLAKCAIKEAISVVQPDALLRLIYVRSLVPISFMEFAPANFDAEQQKDAEEKLNAFAAGMSYPRDRVSTVVRMGGVYPEILAEAETFGADLIIVGSHRPGMSTYFLGSNASQIVRHAECSVLVIRNELMMQAEQAA